MDDRGHVVDGAGRGQLSRLTRVMACGLVAVLTAMVPAPAAAAEVPPLSAWPIRLAGGGPVHIRDNDGRGWEQPGRFSLRNIQRRGDGHLRLTLRVTPAAVDLPVDPGPVVLFVGLGLIGGGSVGYEGHATVSTLAAAPCRADPCSYRFRVDADLTVLPGAATTAPYGSSVEATLGFTLVRTFGGGTWLQVLDTFEAYPSLIRSGHPMSGRIASMGLVPAATVAGWSQRIGGASVDLARRVASAVRGLPDRSRPLPTVRVRLKLDMPGCWPYLTVGIHDDQGTRPLSAELLRLDPAGTVVEVPDGMPWSVSLWQGGMFDGDVVVPAGSFTTAGQELEVTSRVTCSAVSGDHADPLSVAPASTALPSPAVSRSTDWVEALERSRKRSRPSPFTVAAITDGFVALGLVATEGWTEWSSRDGVRWADRIVPPSVGLPGSPELVDAHLWRSDDGVRLTTIAVTEDGSRTLATWRRVQPGRWKVEHTVTDVGAVGSADAFVRHGRASVLLLVPDGAAVDAAPRLLVDAGDGDLVPTGPAVGEVRSVTADPDGFLAIVRTRTGATPTDGLLRSPDGVDWKDAGPLPTGAMDQPQIAATVDGLLVFASDSTATTRGWRWEVGAGWTQVLTAMGSLPARAVIAQGDTLGVVTRSAGRSSVSLAAVSRDGGRTWGRGIASDAGGESCRLSLAAQRSTVVLGVGGCRAEPVATRWAAPMAEQP